ncbi:MAG: hypothetical protein JWQ72_1720 [Polaromonas sp.]|nr:hypothetical protein [Polaromonas sp.]
MSPAPASTQTLARFLDAQDPVYAGVCAELAAGRKTSHWMWFVFPQLKGLGQSPTAKHFGIGSRQEALAYLSHPVLSARLQECTRLMLGVPGKTARDILGEPDDLKFRSCMTLFSEVAPGNPLFQQALARFFDGRPDAKTLALL